MLLNLNWPSNKMTEDELRIRLADFREQEKGLRKMINVGDDFVGSSHSDLEQMLSEVRGEVKKIDGALKAAGTGFSD